MKVTIRKSIETDLETFFLNQADEQANHMAAFTPKNPKDKVAYLKKWKLFLSHDSIHMQTVLVENKVVGCVVKYVMEGNAEITYAIAKECWGKGITTKAVKQFLIIEQTRPIFGRVAFDNIGSQKVLENTGFKKNGTSMWFANARGKEIEEFIYKLE